MTYLRHSDPLTPLANQSKQPWRACSRENSLALLRPVSRVPLNTDHRKIPWLTPARAVWSLFFRGSGMTRLSCLIVRNMPYRIDLITFFTDQPLIKLSQAIPPTFLYYSRLENPPGPGFPRPNLLN